MTTKRRTGLGKGLGALIPPAPTTDRPVDVFFSSAPEEEGDHLVPVPGARLAHIDPREVRPNPKQPRVDFDPDELAELAESLQEVGMLQPIVVRPTGETSTPFELIMGERRLRASLLAGSESIPAIVRDVADDDLLRDALLENLHRAQLNPLEEAAAYQQLLDDFGCTQEELSQRIRRSRPQISNTLRLLKLPLSVQRRVAAGVLSAGHARALLMLPDTDGMERLAAKVVAEGLSVRATEELAALGGIAETVTRTRSPRAEPASEVIEAATQLADHLDTRVKIAQGRSKGRITIEFATPEDLDRIMQIIMTK